MLRAALMLSAFINPNVTCLTQVEEGNFKANVYVTRLDDANVLVIAKMRFCGDLGCHFQRKAELERCT